MFEASFLQPWIRDPDHVGEIKDEASKRKGMKRKRTKGYERTGKSHRGNAHKRVLVSTVGSDFRLIVLSSKEPFVHEAKGLDVFFTPTKRYQEVDGVRKEKERLTTDRLAT